MAEFSFATRSASPTVSNLKMLNAERAPVTGKRVQLMATCLCDAFYDDVAALLAAGFYDRVHVDLFNLTPLTKVSRLDPPDGFPQSP